jgi:hypothetical protein
LHRVSRAGGRYDHSTPYRKKVKTIPRCRQFLVRIRDCFASLVRREPTHEDVFQRATVVIVEPEEHLFLPNEQDISPDEPKTHRPGDALPGEVNGVITVVEPRACWWAMRPCGYTGGLALE